MSLGDRPLFNCDRPVEATWPSNFSTFGPSILTPRTVHFTFETLFKRFLPFFSTLWCHFRSLWCHFRWWWSQKWVGWNTSQLTSATLKCNFWHLENDLWFLKTFKVSKNYFLVIKNAKSLENHRKSWKIIKNLKYDKRETLYY